MCVSPPPWPLPSPLPLSLLQSTFVSVNFQLVLDTGADPGIFERGGGGGWLYTSDVTFITNGKRGTAPFHWSDLPRESGAILLVRSRCYFGENSARFVLTRRNWNWSTKWHFTTLWVITFEHGDSFPKEVHRSYVRLSSATPLAFCAFHAANNFARDLDRLKTERGSVNVCRQIATIKDNSPWHAWVRLHENALTSYFWNKSNDIIGMESLLHPWQCWSPAKTNLSQKTTLNWKERQTLQSVQASKTFVGDCSFSSSSFT